MESFYPGMERLQGCHSVLVWNDSRGVTLFWDGTTPGESFCPGDGTTPGESFCPGMERLQRSPSVLGWNDSRGVILSWYGTSPGESFCPRIERLQGSLSVLG